MSWTVESINAEDWDETQTEFSDEIYALCEKYTKQLKIKKVTIEYEDEENE